MRLIRLVLAAAVLAGTSGQFGLAAEPRTFWAADALTKVPRSAVTPATGADVCRLAGARGEVVSGQAVFRPPQEVKSAQVQVTELANPATASAIPAPAIRLQWVRYVDITRNSIGLPEDEILVKAPASIPDPYWEGSAVPVPAGQAQPVWIEAHIPVDAKPGDYRGTLTVNADGRSAELAVSLQVWDFDMPAQRHLSVVNWWQFPGKGFEGRDQDWELLARFCRFLVEHRQTDVNVGIAMIAETGDAQQGFAQDTSRLERFAETAFAAGIRQIHLHSVGRRTADILDPLCRIEADESAFRRLAAWEKVVEGRGWQRQFAVSIVDEPFLYYEDSYAAVVDLVHRTAPHVRCIEAVEAEYLGKLDIYVPKLSHLAMWYPRFDQVRKDGAELWFYICNHPSGRYPNRWLDQSLLKPRVLFWICYLYDLDGYLHWGLNQYAGDPYTQEGLSKDLPLGERAVAYPGRDQLIGSLRFSAQRDGIQDYEYLSVLEERLQQIKARVGPDAFWLDPRQRSLELCRRVVWSFHDYTRDPTLLLATRAEIAAEIEALGIDPLVVVQTTPPEGTVVPAGPRHINVRGLIPPGATITINGAQVKNVRPSGYFRHVHFMPDDKPIIRLVIQHQGRTREIVRRFRLSD